MPRRGDAPVTPATGTVANPLHPCETALLDRSLRRRLLAHGLPGRPRRLRSGGGLLRGGLGADRPASALTASSQTRFGPRKRPPSEEALSSWEPREVLAARTVAPEGAEQDAAA